MTRLARRLNKRFQPALYYVPSWLGGLGHSRLFGTVEGFCLFVGYPRSGHSLVGSLLNAHPNIVLAHELDALRYVAAGYRKHQLYWMILRRDAEFTRSGRRWTEFDYSVPGQWQGRFDQLRIIGDKKGGRTTYALERRPEVLARLERIVGTDVRLIHVVRNPFDNIATMSKRSHRTPDVCAADYFALCRTTDELRSSLGPGSMIDVRHESLVADPKACLRSLCGSLGMSADEEYLSACAAIVHATPHLSRLDVLWSEGLLQSVEERMAAFDFLDGYSFG